MLNQINEGITITYTNPSSSDKIPAGTPIALGAGVAGVAVDDIPASGVGVLQLRGTYTLPKTSSATITAGAGLKIVAGEVEAVTINSAATTADLASIVAVAAETSTGNAPVKALLK